MKLIIREYLSSLKEREELDAILPGLLSQMGLNVLSRPGRGTRQDGVDVAAVGRIDHEDERVYLFTIKNGDLTRSNWSSGSAQDVRPSLEEILDSYINNKIPAEHREKKVVICICIGGDVQEQVRSQVAGFINNNSGENVAFEEWNGDKLADLIQENFLNEDLLPRDSRPRLRKALAMLDEPDTSYKHFASLLSNLSNVDDLTDLQRLRAIRQISICLWMLFAWARDVGNLEAAYRSGELAILKAWKIVKIYSDRNNSFSRRINDSYVSILFAYLNISIEYLNKCVLPFISIRDGLSSAIRGSCSLDVNLKLFDIISRIALRGFWEIWDVQTSVENSDEAKKRIQQITNECTEAIVHVISNNTALFLPIKDDQAIDIAIVGLLLAREPNRHKDLKIWFTEMLERAYIAYKTHGLYPCNLNNYSELLDHPKQDDNYRVEVTEGSILYPLIATYAAIFDFDEVYEAIAEMKTKLLQHCNFQVWYPNDDSEANIYDNYDIHGAILADPCVEKEKAEFIEQIFSECDQFKQFHELSAIKLGFWPLILVACKHYRLPVPLHYLEEFSKPSSDSDSEVTQAQS